ncbi:baseplate J/gp47 family protein [Fructobacillus tropaeoli]|uniref:Uncharacterized protein n=1 Tax=Fructobacillus tropaeoli TaxID=709323 RepID=A0A3F3H1L3_9LACO|nr:baseplate J/gp47 family protein [Fructobacillus tropaeoli]GAP04875.1 hypothetical protein FTRO_0110100 [Fructobacillus tropaeoli]
MTPTDLLKEIEQQDFEYFMAEMLNRVPDTLDKREGAIIYDAMAPVAYNMAEIVHQFHTLILNTYTQTAVGEFLDYRAAERGVKRKPATNSIVLAGFFDANGQDFNVDLGSRFASVGVNPIYYKVTEKIVDGKFRLKAEQPGHTANRYVGQILPISNINGFGYGEIKSVEIPARDDESDDDLRSRILQSNDFTEYGGNVSDYISMIRTMKDVGAVQVYPTWQGGGTVKLVIVDNDYKLPSSKLIANTQQIIDPQDSSGNGYGMAPIGHTVTVAAPSARTLDFDIEVELDDGISQSDVRQPVFEAVNRFIDDVKKTKWGTLKNERVYQVNIYVSQIVASILKVPGILNVPNLKINGNTKDVQLQFDNNVQELPVIGRVTVNG